MPRSAFENIRLMRNAITVLLCLCSGMAGFYWAHVLDIGMIHVQGHPVLIGAFFFTLAALVFVIAMEVLATRALRVAENIRAINTHVPGRSAGVAPSFVGTNSESDTAQDVAPTEQFRGSAVPPRPPAADATDPAG